MTLAVFYWILMLLWLLFGLWSHWPSTPTEARAWAPFGGNLILFLLLLILGIAEFGGPVK